MADENNINIDVDLNEEKKELVKPDVRDASTEVEANKSDLSEIGNHDNETSELHLKILNEALRAQESVRLAEEGMADQHDNTDELKL